MVRTSAAAYAVVLIGVIGSDFAYAAQRAFVASSGNDANTATGCTITTPCRGFTAALSVVDPGGEVVALDAAGYGPVNITKSVTITANPGFYAGISAGSVHGVTVATPGVKVTLRGLNINGGASRGVSFTNGAALSIENCLITNFASEGVFVNTAAEVRIIDSTIRGNGWGVVLVAGAVATMAGSKVMGSANEGLSVSASPPGTTTIAAVSDSVFSGNLVGLSVTAPHAATAYASMSRSMVVNNGKGVLADGGAGTVLITVGDSLVTGNTVGGLVQVGSATLESRNNVVRQNGSDTSGAITTLAGASSGTVTSVGTGSGLTGGPITTSGTIGLASTQLLPSVGCTTNQIPKWNGSGWACAADNDTGGTVTAVTASAPLASSGGTAPNITLTGGTAGQVLTGTATAPAWSGSVSLNGNVTLVNPSTATAGNVMKGTHRFIHNFGDSNTFIGEHSGNFTMSGYYNTGNGSLTLSSNTTGFGNTASGVGALSTNTTGNDNTATGLNTLSSNTAGEFNTATGAAALNQNTNGYENTANGALALQGNTSGFDNTAVGYQAMTFNTTGSFNTAVGSQVLGFNTTGSNNVAIGHGAGINLTTGSFNIVIGNTGVAAQAGTIRIGDSNQTRAFISGIRGTTTGNADAVAVLIDSTGQLGTVNSSRRFKDDIADMDAASSGLMKLRPVTFHYKADGNPSGRRLQYGLIAEEVADVYPDLVAHSADGQAETVMYQYLPAMLLNEYQKQQRTIDRQSEELAEQSEIVAELKRDRDLLNEAVAEIAKLKQETAILTQLVNQHRAAAIAASSSTR
jgi:hypothetical protein